MCFYIDAESVTETTGSRNLPGRMSHISVVKDDDTSNENRNNRTMTSARPKKRQKALVKIVYRLLAVLF